MKRVTSSKNTGAKTKKSSTIKVEKISKNESITVRAIENGFIIRREGQNNKGNYISSEQYVKELPQVFSPKPKK